MLKTNEKRKMRLAVRVLLRSVQPNECLATQGTLAGKDRFDYVSASFHLFGINCFPKSCRDCFCISTNAIFASWYPGLRDRGGTCLSTSTLRK